MDDIINEYEWNKWWWMNEWIDMINDIMNKWSIEYDVIMNKWLSVCDDI